MSTVSVLSGGDGHAEVLFVRGSSYAGTVVDLTVRFSDRVGNTTVSQLVPVASFDSRSARPAP